MASFCCCCILFLLSNLNPYFAQVELNKKREAEVGKLRKDLEECNIQHESTILSLKKKQSDSISEMNEQMDQLNKMKTK